MTIFWRVFVSYIFSEPRAAQGGQKKLNPGLVTSYDLRHGNGAGLFSKEKVLVSKEVDK